jgi:hypothetical protein
MRKIREVLRLRFELGLGQRAIARAEAEEDYDICAEASNGREAIDLALKHRPER